MRIPLIALCLVCVACYGRPKDPAGWAEAATRRPRTAEKLEALREARRAPGDRKAAVPYLVVLLKETPRVRAEAAQALGEAGDPAAVPALLAAIESSAQLPADAKEANRRIASALGVLHARQAVPALTELLRSRDGFTQVAAVDALGEIGDPAAVEALLALATGEEVEPFVSRKALMALGRIGDQRAGPGVLRMLFRERARVSFFPEAAFAAYQIGSPLISPLVSVLKGQDQDLNAWAKKNGVLPGALRAKSAQLLGDMGDSRVVPALIENLAYKDPRPEVQLLVRVCAAGALGRLRAQEAVQPIGRLLQEEKDDSDARDQYSGALVFIGSPAGLAPLRATAAKGEWEMRGGILASLSRLGAQEDRELLTRAASEIPAHAAEVARMLDRITVAGECGTELKCWTARLSDSRGWVRDRAALEVGRRGEPAQAEALAIAASLPVNNDDELAARSYAILALGWITKHGDVGGLAVAERLEALVEREKGRSLTAAVNEEAMRLAMRLRRNAAR